jgi:hypothetical protein
VLGVADLLRGKLTDPEQKRLLDVLAGSGESLLRIINDILDFSKIEAEKLELRPGAFELSSLLAEIHALLGMQASDKHIRFVVDAEPALPRTVMGDRQRLSQVLLNLGSNAVKFTDRGEVRLVVRKIQMLIEAWDRVRLAEQESIFGRAKRDGAPLSGGTEFTDPDFAVAEAGAPVIDVAAHVRLAHPSNNGGVRILRRGYNYVDGNNPYGRLDAGLLFISYQRSPAQFISLQRALGSDLLNEYIRHIGSSTFAIPPGPTPGGFIADALFA